MEKVDLTSRRTLLLCLLVGAIGAVGQALKLYNTLAHSYPFKLMDTPPWKFYGEIGRLGLFISPVIAVAAALCLRKARTEIIPSIPVVVCPLAYWLIFELCFLFSKYNGDSMIAKNFDGYTGETARYAFAFEVLALLFWGLVCGLASGAAISWFNSFVLLGTARRLR